jgi:hypothetical protein
VPEAAAATATLVATETLAHDGAQDACGALQFAATLRQCLPRATAAINASCAAATTATEGALRRRQLQKQAGVLERLRSFTGPS